MKVKLLKKIRKQFSWYKSTTNTLVLLDHKSKKAMTVDKELMKITFPSFPEENINESSLFRLLKYLMTREIYPGYLRKVDYNFANRRFKSRYTKN